MHHCTESFLDTVFSENGPLAKSFATYEKRSSQEEMAEQVMQTFSEHQISLIEAGTGTGKSFAYLLPALHYAVKERRPIIVSTHTIALQEQLAFRDLPFLLKALDLDLNVVLVKGMGNYLCLKRYEEEPSTSSIFAASDRQMNRLNRWVKQTQEGSFSDISFSLDSSLWNRVNAESEQCTHAQCPHYKKCFFFRAREEVEKAHILIVNHHLLFADLLARSREEERTILPDSDHLIIDEAHHLTTTARHCLSRELDRKKIFPLLSSIISEKKENGILVSLRESLSHPGLLSQVETDIPTLKHELALSFQTAFSTLDQFVGKHLPYTDKKLLTKTELNLSFWKKEIIPAFTECKDHLAQLIKNLACLSEDIKHLIDREEKKAKASCVQLDQLCRRLEEIEETIDLFLSDTPSDTEVLSVEKNPQAKLLSVPLSLSSFLQEQLFERFSSLTLCSASLATAKSFSYLRHELGLTESTRVEEKIYPSPFDYQNNVYFALPSDLPSPEEPSFLSESVEQIAEAIRLTKGGAFILFTSYHMLHQAHEILDPIFEDSEITLLKQGNTSRTKLLEQFQETPHSVLLGTDSFWEGVDVPGEELRLVIITKLPFPVPSEPLFEAQSTQYRKEGKNPFMSLAVPQTSLKLKQGFGRLIRSQSDRGIVLLLDKRIQTKSYGANLLSSLPLTEIDYAPWKTISKKIQHFENAL